MRENVSGFDEARGGTYAKDTLHMNCDRFAKSNARKHDRGPYVKRNGRNQGGNMQLYDINMTTVGKNKNQNVTSCLEEDPWEDRHRVPIGISHR